MRTLLILSALVIVSAFMVFSHVVATPHSTQDQSGAVLLSQRFSADRAAVGGIHDRTLHRAPLRVPFRRHSSLGVLVLVGEVQSTVEL